MAMETPTELEAFQQFIEEQITSGNTGLSPEESLQAWRARQREYEASVKAVKEGWEDAKAGRMRPLEEVADEIRKKHGFSSQT